MARVRYQQPIAQVSGSLRRPGHPPRVSVRAGSQPPVALTRPTRASAATPPQAWVRSAIQPVITAWHSLTRDQADAWRSFAHRLTFRNSLGQPYHPSGFNAFRFVNAVPYLGGLAILSDPPASASPVPIGIISNVHITTSGAIYHLIFTAPQPYIYAAHRISLPMPPATNRRLPSLDYAYSQPSTLVSGGGPPPYSIGSTQEFRSVTPGLSTAVEITTYSAGRIPSKPQYFLAPVS